MPDELLTVFKLCFLALLYLFFFRVLRAVWTEVTAPAAPSPQPAPSAPSAPAAPAPSPARPKATRRAARKAAAPAEQPRRETARPSRLVALEPPHLVGIEYALADGMSIGRSEASTVAIDDSFLSGRHASFALRDGAWVVEDLGSTNGTYLNRQRVERLARLSIGDQVQLGNVVLEVR